MFLRLGRDSSLVGMTMSVRKCTGNGNFYLRGFANFIPFTWANCGDDAPKTDLMYFFTSPAMSYRPVSVA